MSNPLTSLEAELLAALKDVQLVICDEKIADVTITRVATGKVRTLGEIVSAAIARAEGKAQP